MVFGAWREAGDGGADVGRARRRGGRTGSLLGAIPWCFPVFSKLKDGEIFEAAFGYRSTAFGGGGIDVAAERGASCRHGGGGIDRNIGHDDRLQDLDGAI